MKAIIPISFAILLGTTTLNKNTSFVPSNLNEVSPTEIFNDDKISNNTGLEYYSYPTDVNTKYSEFGSGVFRNKFIIVSSKKIGGFGNGVDKNTNEPFTELFCLDIKKDASLENPLFFSRILNTKHNEGQVAFTSDEKTIYYTRSLRKNAKNYQLFKATLDVNSSGKWINHKKITFNNMHSVETPFVSADGKSLYFSSNRPGGFGGFDLYVAPIKGDGTIGEPVNLGATVNSDKDEKYPQLSKDEKRLFFASNGHEGFGAMDLFVSRKLKDSYKAPRNLGNKVNTASNEVALTFVDDVVGYFSSNKKGGEGSYDLYKIEAQPVFQELEGTIVDGVTDTLLPNSTVVLYDEDNDEIARQTTGADAHFSFKAMAFENYTIKVEKEGFENTESVIADNTTYKSILKTVVKLNSDSAVAKKK
jgi:hypothetical protein